MSHPVSSRLASLFAGFTMNALTCLFQSPIDHGGCMHWLTLEGFYSVFYSPQLAFPAGASPLIELVLRWIHFVAGITWVGLLYFFVLVNARFLPQLDPPARLKVVPALMPRALWWFRWSSVVAVLAGITYWSMIVSADAHNANTNGGAAMGTF